MRDDIKVISVDLPEELEKVEIIPIGDYHEGDEFCDEALMDSVIEYILAKPYRYAILNGDMINNAIKTAVSDIYTEDSNPEEQIARVARRFWKIRERILAIGTGNHEERTYKLTGIDPSRYLAVRLGLEERYSPNSFLLFVSVGRSHNSRDSNIKKQVYSIFSQHGFGGGKKNGSKLNNLNDLDKIVADCDLYITNHTHTPILNAMRTFICDLQNKKIIEKKKYFMNANAYMRFGGYGLRYGFAPSALDITYATFYTQGRKKTTLTLGI